MLTPRTSNLSTPAGAAVSWVFWVRGTEADYRVVDAQTWAAARAEASTLLGEPDLGALVGRLATAVEVELMAARELRIVVTAATAVIHRERARRKGR